MTLSPCVWWSQYILLLKHQNFIILICILKQCSSLQEALQGIRYYFLRKYKSRSANIAWSKCSESIEYIEAERIIKTAEWYEVTRRGNIKLYVVLYICLPHVEESFYLQIKHPVLGYPFESNFDTLLGTYFLSSHLHFEASGFYS